ncbi:MAG: D-glycero-beta-D-manno-heptose-7-phosphate kinase [Flavobacteriales bacterium]|nr:D-glycero-beta-D-manno-heptose-7-phosphate kinase [Flavobacteriales bacterium]
MNVLIIGDVMVDAYYWGKVDRISPEAPVPIVSVNKREARMGGAANVALNIQAMGANPILCSVIGSDEEGDEFLNLLENAGQSKTGILRSSTRITTKKTRVIGNSHQMLRIDAEDTKEINHKEQEDFYLLIEQIINNQNIDVIIFEDYDKGVITKSLIQKVVDLAIKNNIPTTVDPKKVNFMAYKNVSLFKPNLKELKEGLKVDFNHRNQSELEQTVQELERQLNNQITLLTLSELGIYVKSNKFSVQIKAHHRDITDVSGAGDTVISVASLCLAAKQDVKLIAELSNLAGGLVCENVGVVPIVKEKLLEEAKQILTP